MADDRYNPVRDEKRLYTMAEWAEQMKLAVDDYAEEETPAPSTPVPVVAAELADKLAGRKRTFGEWLRSFGRYMSW